MIACLIPFILISQSDNLEAMRKYMLAHELFRENAYKEVIVLCDEALKLDPNLKDVYNIYGIALMNCGYIDTAQVIYENIISRYPENAWLYYVLALIYMKQDKYTMTDRTLERAIDIDSTVQIYYYTRGLNQHNWGKDLIKAETYLRKALSIHPNDYSVILMLGTVLEDQDKIDEAQSLYQETMRNQRDSIPDFYHHGELAMRVQDWEYAIENFRVVYKTCRDYEDIELNMATCYEHLGDAHKAITHYLRALEQDPERNPDVYISLGRLYEKYDDFRSAQELYNQAVQQFDDEVIFYVDLVRMHYELHIDSAWLWAEKALTKFPESSLPYYAMGFLYSHDDSLDAAEEYIRTALSIDPDIAKYWHQIAKVYHKKGNIDSACVAYRRAMQHDSLNIDTYINLGILYCDTEEYTNAIDIFNSVLNYDRTNRYALYNLGWVYRKQKNAHRALDYFLQVIDLYPENKEAYEQITGIIDDIERYTILKKQLLKNIKKTKKYSDPYYMLSYIYIEEAAYDSALIMIKQAVDVDPDDNYLYNTAGHIYMLLENPHKALESFNHALTIDPSDSASAVCICGIYYEMGDYEEAKQELLILCDKYPGFAPTHYFLGMIYAKEENYEATLRELNMMIELMPEAKDFEDVREMIDDAQNALEQQGKIK